MTRFSALQVAKDFADGAQEPTVTDALTGEYKLSFNGFEEYYQGPDYLESRTISPFDFIGGIAYELAVAGEIDSETATSSFVGDVCFALGAVMAQRRYQEDMVALHG